MGIQDFLFGEPDQPDQLDPRIQAARNFLLEEMMKQYAAGQVNVPTYQAVIPESMYSGTNDLLSSLGLSPVSVPSMPTTNIGGVDAYTSQPIQEAMQGQSSVGGGGAYGSFQGFGVAGTGSGTGGGSGTGSGSGGGQYHPVVNSGGGYNTSTTSINTPLSYLPGGVNDPFLTSAPSQAIASLSTPSNMTRTTTSTPSITGGTLPAGSYVASGSTAPTTSIRPVARPSNLGQGGSGNLFQSLLGGAQKILDIPVLGDIAGMTIMGQLAQKGIDAYGRNANQELSSTPSGGGLFANILSRTPSPNPNQAAADQAARIAAPSAGVEKARQADLNNKSRQLAAMKSQPRTAANIAAAEAFAQLHGISYKSHPWRN